MPIITDEIIDVNGKKIKVSCYQFYLGLLLWDCYDQYVIYNYIGHVIYNYHAVQIHLHVVTHVISKKHCLLNYKATDPRYRNRLNLYLRYLRLMLECNLVKVTTSNHMIVSAVNYKLDQ